tara:strand:+ start:210 stop:500 length:291 start_codon:yes stop_codon:yes gene_type:complete
MRLTASEMGVRSPRDELLRGKQLAQFSMPSVRFSDRALRQTCKRLRCPVFLGQNPWRKVRSLVVLTDVLYPKKSLTAQFELVLAVSVHGSKSMTTT